jgi:hypothetical protein
MGFMSSVAVVLAATFLATWYNDHISKEKFIDEL